MSVWTRPGDPTRAATLPFAVATEKQFTYQRGSARPNLLRMVSFLVLSTHEQVGVCIPKACNATSLKRLPVTGNLLAVLHQEKQIIGVHYVSQTIVKCHCQQKLITEVISLNYRYISSDKCELNEHMYEMSLLSSEKMNLFAGVMI